MSKSIILSSPEEGPTNDFVTTIYPPIELSIPGEGGPAEVKWEISLSKASMYYSWYSISAAHGNNRYLISSDFGGTWATVIIPDGAYNIDQLNAVFDPNVAIVAVPARQRVKVTLNGGYEVEFPANGPWKILGFNSGQKLTAPITVAPNKADITNGIDTLLIHTDIVDRQSSYVDGAQSSIIYSLSPMTVPPGSLFEAVTPGSQYWLNVTPRTVSSIRVWVTDESGRLIDFGGEKTTFHFLLRESSY